MVCNVHAKILKHHFDYRAFDQCIDISIYRSSPSGIALPKMEVLVCFCTAVWMEWCCLSQTSNSSICPQRQVFFPNTRFLLPSCHHFLLLLPLPSLPLPLLPLPFPLQSAYIPLPYPLLPLPLPSLPLPEAAEGRKQEQIPIKRGKKEGDEDI